MSTLRWQWRRLQRLQKYDLYYCRKVDVRLTPWRAHPTVIEFCNRFGSTRSIVEAEDCDFNVHAVEDEIEPEIKVEYINGTVDILNYNQPIERLAEDFFRRRRHLEFVTDFNESMKHDEEENPFTTGEMIAQKKKAK
ncbi:hypothetical protein QOT17_005728 [Balamuthia mandrillaris]